MTSGRYDRASIVAWWVTGAVCVVAFAALLGTSDASLGQRWSRWSTERRILKEARRMWPELFRTGYVGGPREAPVVVEFMDYECPFCRQVEPELLEAVNRGDIRLHIVHLPIVSLHRNAKSAAVAAICAERQGRLGAMHGNLMSNDRWRQSHDFLTVARESGVPDLAQFKVCFTDGSASAEVAKQTDMADRLRIAGTPVFVTRSAVHIGALADGDLRRLITRR